MRLTSTFIDKAKVILVDSIDKVKITLASFVAIDDKN